MDFLKRHYDKIVLALALLVLIASAVYLASKLEQLNREGPTRRAGAGKVIPPLNVGVYTNAIASLQTPPQWNFEARDLFNTSPLGDIEEHVPSGVVTSKVPVEVKIYLMKVEYKPFKLLFKAYTWNEDKQEPSNIQMNFRTFSRTFIVPAVGDEIKDRFESTHYKITKFEKKSAKMNIPGVGERDVDVSQLTIESDRKSVV